MIRTCNMLFFFFSSRRRHTRCSRDWSSDVCSSDLDVALHGGDPFPTERLTGPQPPLAGDQLEAAVAPGNGAHHDGLQQPGLTNGGLELLQRRGVDVTARLIRVGADVGDRQLDETPFALRFLARGPQQGFEAPAETTATCDGFRHAGTSGSGSAAGGGGGGAVTAARAPRAVSARAPAREPSS